jgi:NAD(P)-dependent dehydrogenase (short-subunit alcohol dehydrogenase family)
LGLTRSLVREVEPSRITFNVPAPGFLDTGIESRFSRTGQEGSATCGVRRIAEVEDVAYGVQDLLGPNAKNIVATVLTVGASSSL